MSISTATKTGVADLKNAACERLLEKRVEQKLQGKKPLVVSKGTSVTHETNFPRHADMLLGYIDCFGEVPVEEQSFEVLHQHALVIIC